ncbi:MAG: hypothetical protein V4726_21355 [Verrucomicrobiota bacterium]
MNITLQYLRKLCRSSNAASNEIILTAWHYAKRHSMSPEELIYQLPKEISTVIQRASRELFSAMLSGSTGMLIGAGIRDDLESSPNFVPADFILRLKNIL